VQRVGARFTDFRHLGTKSLRFLAIQLLEIGTNYFDSPANHIFKYCRARLWSNTVDSPRCLTPRAAVAALKSLTNLPILITFRSPSVNAMCALREVLDHDEAKFVSTKRRAVRDV